MNEEESADEDDKVEIFFSKVRENKEGNDIPKDDDDGVDLEEIEKEFFEHIRNEESRQQEQEAVSNVESCDLGEGVGTLEDLKALLARVTEYSNEEVAENDTAVKNGDDDNNSEDEKQTAQWDVPNELKKYVPGNLMNTVCMDLRPPEK